MAGMSEQGPQATEWPDQGGLTLRIWKVTGLF